MLPLPPPCVACSVKAICRYTLPPCDDTRLLYIVPGRMQCWRRCLRCYGEWQEAANTSMTKCPVAASHCSTEFTLVAAMRPPLHLHPVEDIILLAASALPQHRVQL